IGETRGPSITTLLLPSTAKRLADRFQRNMVTASMSAGKILLIVGGVIAAIILVAALSVSGIYNRLVTLQQGTDAAWAQVQNVYQRRADLVPNLVNTVAGAANFERTTLNEVVQARASVGQ